MSYNKNLMKAGIFDPYLDTVGGGERYCLTLAELLLAKNWQVDLFWPDEKIRTKLIEKFALDLNRVNFVSYTPRENNLINRYKFERRYELLFYFSDGSIPIMFGKKNILHFQVPFQNVLTKSLKNSFKLKTIDFIVCNSFFTKKVIDNCLGTNSLVVYPPVDIKAFKPLEKENIILSVARFSQLLQGKKQDVLVDTFKELTKQKNLDKWKLVLAGGTEVGGGNFVKNLRNAARGFSIEIIENPPFSELLRLYGKAKIFWTASGFGINEGKEPERVEHFGITTVEAMAAGCAPIVLGAGGQKEIVENGANGFLWKKTGELKDLTLKVIEEPALMKKISQNAILRSKAFSKEEFYRNISQLIEE